MEAVFGALFCTAKKYSCLRRIILDKPLISMYNVSKCEETQNEILEVTNMFNTQMNYWNDMMKNVQSAYQTSLKSGVEFQKAFSGLLGEMFETSYSNTMKFQKEMNDIGTKMMDNSNRQFDRFNSFYNGAVEANNKRFQSILNKYCEKNQEMRGEMESLWKDNQEIFRQQVKELSSMVSSNQKENMDELFKMYKDFSDKSMEDMKKKIDEMGKKSEA